MSTKSRVLNASARKNLSCAIYVSADVSTFLPLLGPNIFHDCPPLPEYTSNIEFTSIMIYVAIEQRGMKLITWHLKHVSYLVFASFFKLFLRHFRNVARRERIKISNRVEIIPRMKALSEIKPLLMIHSYAMCE